MNISLNYSTSKTVIGPATLLPPDQQALITLLYNSASWFRIFVTLLVPFSLFSSIINLIIFLFIWKQWKNKSKHYYILIAVFNLAHAITIDFLTMAFDSLFLFSFFVLGYNKSVRIFPRNWNDFWCVGIGYSSDTWDMLVRWTLTIFACHRMLIIAMPMKFVVINKFMNKKLVLLLLILFSLLMIPHVFLTRITISGNCFSLLWQAGELWFMYFTITTTFLSFFTPLTFLLISNLVIILLIFKASKTRRELTHQSGSMKSSKEKKTTKLLVLLSIIYFVSIFPLILANSTKLITGATA